MMRLAWLVALCSLTTHAQYNGGVELGRLGARYNKDNAGRGIGLQDHQRRDKQRHDGVFNRNAIWLGKAAERDDAFRRNEQQFRDQAASRRQDYANNNKNFGNIVQQIRDEGLKNAYKINEAARYNRNDQDQANGYNAANARKNAFDRGNNLEDNIQYKFNKKFNKQSSESGGFEDENGRKYSKLDLIDEREKDQAIKRRDKAVSRHQNDKQQAIKEEDWRANANQGQAQAGQFGFADRRLEAAGERSDDRAIDYNRKDNQFRENERGVDSAIRLAKDLAEQAAGYRNEATANADALRNVNDKKYYGGKEIANKAGVNHGYAEGVAGPRGPKARNEGSGGKISSGFKENADQREKGEELARATALSAADARNEYNRLKDRLVFDEVKGLKDRAQGAFKQGLSDSANQGFSSNAAEAAKHASESDKRFAGAASASDFAAKQKALDEALRDRDYFLKKQNDENETFSRRKQFFHNKREGGANDEELNYDRKKKAREFGAAEEADLAKHNQFARAHKDAKIATSSRNFEDASAKRAKLHHAKDDRIQTASGSGERSDEEGARAGSKASAFGRRQGKEFADDSRSEQFQKKHALWDDAETRKSKDEEGNQHAKAIKADVESLNVGSEGPFGNIDSRTFVEPIVLNQAPLSKKQKERKIPNIEIDIRPLRKKAKSSPPKRQVEIPDLPPVHPVKNYAPVKYNKKEVDYTTHVARPSYRRNRDQGSLFKTGFQRIGSNLFSRPNGAFSRLNSDILRRATGRGAATSAFKKPALSFRRGHGTGLGSLTRQPGSFGQSYGRH